MKIYNAGHQVEVPGQTLFDWYSSTVLYIGEALSGSGQSDPAWTIKRITFDSSGNPIKIEWAGAGSSTNQWSQRLSLAFS